MTEKNYTKAKVVKDRGIQLSGGGKKEAFIPTDILPGVKDAFIHEDFLIITGDGEDSLSINSLDPQEIEQHILDNVKAGFKFSGSSSNLVDDTSPTIATDTSGIHNQFQQLLKDIQEKKGKFMSEPKIVPQNNNQPKQ